MLGGMQFGVLVELPLCESDGLGCWWRCCFARVMAGCLGDAIWGASGGAVLRADGGAVLRA